MVVLTFTLKKEFKTDAGNLVTMFKELKDVRTLKIGKSPSVAEPVEIPKPKGESTAINIFIRRQVEESLILLRI